VCTQKDAVEQHTGACCLLLAACCLGLHHTTLSCTMEVLVRTSAAFLRSEPLDATNFNVLCCDMLCPGALHAVPLA
jgi:hypothetical protein